MPCTANSMFGTYSATDTAPLATSFISSGGIQIHAAITLSSATSKDAGRMRRARLA